MSLSNRDRDCKHANSLFKPRFGGRRRRGILNSLLAHVSNLSSKTTIKIKIKSLKLALIRKTKRTAFKMPFS